MRSCLVAYVKHLKERRVRHICKMEKLEIRAVIKYLCKKGIPPKEIHEDFLETLGKESPSYSTVKKMRTPKMPPLMKMSRSCTP